MTTLTTSRPPTSHRITTKTLRSAFRCLFCFVLRSFDLESMSHRITTAVALFGVGSFRFSLLLFVRSFVRSSRSTPRVDVAGPVAAEEDPRRHGRIDRREVGREPRVLRAAVGGGVGWGVAG